MNLLAVLRCLYNVNFLPAVAFFNLSHNSTAYKGKHLLQITNIESSYLPSVDGMSHKDKHYLGLKRGILF